MGLLQCSCSAAIHQAVGLGLLSGRCRVAILGATKARNIRTLQSLIPEIDFHSGPFNKMQDLD